jgi:hypothetical protein
MAVDGLLAVLSRNHTFGHALGRIIMRVKVNVTQEHIDKGRSIDAALCPITLALRSAGFITPVVNPYNLFMHLKGGKHLQVQTLKKVKRFIGRFDYSGKEAVQPFSSYINVPQE